MYLVVQLYSIPIDSYAIVSVDVITDILLMTQNKAMANSVCDYENKQQERHGSTLISYEVRRVREN